ncbi:hypothetical protein R1flu_003613 [Riccia fluitans]|uniref:Secreted protein n=1 Tax=Riccia fluitans TaxID=41844 RepID=A0ABD1Y9I8_9MARC
MTSTSYLGLVLAYDSISLCTTFLARLSNVELLIALDRCCHSFRSLELGDGASSRPFLVRSASSVRNVHFGERDSHTPHQIMALDITIVSTLSDRGVSLQSF